MSYICHQERKGFARQKKRYAPNLEDENLGNFQKARLNKAGGHDGFTHMRGAVSPFSIIGFSQDLHLETGKDSPALLLCGYEKT